MRRLLATAALGLTIPMIVNGQAALLPPVTIDANTGLDALDVGASIGNRRGWAAFVQTTGGVQRLYVAYAEEGAFSPPFLADRGNAVTAAALAGNDAGDAIVVFTEQVGAKGVLFSRRLSGGQAAEALQASAIGTNAVIRSPLAGLHHARIVAVTASGAAAVCYRDADTDAIYVGTLAPSAGTWLPVGPLKSTRCDDIAVDARGNVIVVSQDQNNDLVADRIVNGALRSEVIDAEGMDEPSVALSTAGTAVALARVDAGGNFAAAAWRKADVAQDGAWTKLGVVDAAVRANGENTSFPRAALNAAGRGVVTFNVTNPGTNSARVYSALTDASKTSGVVGTPQKLADVKVGQVPVPNVLATGDPLVQYQATAPNGKLLPVVHVFVRGAPGPARPLLPESGDDVELLNVPSFAADTPGNFLAVLRRYSTPVRAVGVFGDFVPPALNPAAVPRRPRLGFLVVLRANAADSFAALRPGAATWRFPRGAVQGKRIRVGDRLSVRFLRRGRVRVTLTALDRAGNRAQLTRTITVAPTRPRVRVRGGVVVGSRFVPRLRVTLRLQQGKRGQRLAAPRADRRGRFRVRLRARGGRYVLVACQLGCRVKARRMVRIG